MIHTDHTRLTQIIHGSCKLYMDCTDHTWLIQILHGSYISYIASTDHAWLIHIINGSYRSYTAYTDHAWLIQIIHGVYRSHVAHTDHARPMHIIHGSHISHMVINSTKHYMLTHHKRLTHVILVIHVSHGSCACPASREGGRHTRPLEQDLRAALLLRVSQPTATPRSAKYVLIRAISLTRVLVFCGINPFKTIPAFWGQST